MRAVVGIGSGMLAFSSDRSGVSHSDVDQARDFQARERAERHLVLGVLRITSEKGDGDGNSKASHAGFPVRGAVCVL